MLFGNYEAFVNKFMTCARTRKFGEQILGKEFFLKEHTKPLFKKQNILSFQNLYAYHCCLEVCKILKFRTPISLYSHFTPSSRKPCLLITPVPSTDFFYKSAKIWNRLSKHFLGNLMDYSFELASMKSKLKQHLLTIQADHNVNEWCVLNHCYE